MNILFLTSLSIVSIVILLYFAYKIVNRVGRETLVDKLNELTQRNLLLHKRTCFKDII